MARYSSLRSLSMPFQTFWQVGYEGADHVDLASSADKQANGHAVQAYEDYSLLASFGIQSVRESVGWRSVEKNGRFDFSSLRSRLEAASDLDIQICWTFCHYGWPDDVDVFAPEFITRFANFCRATAEFLEPFSDFPPVYSPIHEISYTSYALSAHLLQCRNMYDPRAQTHAKRQLVRAAIAGCNAIWEINSRARILHCEQITHRPPTDIPDCVQWPAVQYEAWDMLMGRREPELGGDPRYLDILGINYYQGQQQDKEFCKTSCIPRRRPLQDILVDLSRRYRRSMAVAETSQVESERGILIQQIAEDANLATERGADIRSLCLYPAVEQQNPNEQSRTPWLDARRQQNATGVSQRMLSSAS